MKYLYYFAGVVLGALTMMLVPNVALAAEPQPILETLTPTQYTNHTFTGGMLVVTGQQWPDRQYGLSVQLFDRQTLNTITLDTVSYTPLGNRMVVRIPYHVPAPATTRSYDVVLSTINGTRTIRDNAILVQVNEPVEAAPPSGGTEEPAVTPPVVIPAPSTDIVRATDNAPFITGYAQERIWSADSGGLLVLMGGGWPTANYGLIGFLVNTTTGLRVNLETISYVPIAGRMVVQTPNYATGATTGWYNLVVMTPNGQMTTVRHAIEYLG